MRALFPLAPTRVLQQDANELGLTLDDIRRWVPPRSSERQPRPERRKQSELSKKRTKPPTVYVIAGPNGAGKTTFASQFLPDFVKCLEFLNADLIAAGLSP